MVYRRSKLLSVLLLLAILQCAHMHVQMHHETVGEEDEERKIIEITLSTAKHKSECGV